MKNKVTVTGANIVFLVFTALFIGSQFFMVFFAELITPNSGADFFIENIYQITFLNQYIFILLPPVIYAIIIKSDLKKTFRLNKLKLLSAFYIVIMAIPAYFTALALNSIILFLVQFAGTIPPQPVPIPQTPTQLITGLFFIALTPAICEEAFHRGMMLSAYERRGSAKAVIFTAILFGVFHFDITNFLGPVFLGLLIGYYVIRTNSIFAGVLAHFLNNGFALVMQYMARNEIMPTDSITIALPDLIGILIYGAVGAGLLMIFRKLFDKSTLETYRERKSISIMKKDMASILTHWPVVVVLCVYVFLTGMYFLTISML